MSEFRGFPREALTFLRQLKRHNDRTWFAERKATFEAQVRAPMIAFVEELDVRLATLAPEIHGTPKRSIFRIHRDTRFSRDKSPYKTNLGCWFTHVHAGHGVGSETHGAGAGFYFHLEPGGCFVAAGIWMPPREALQAIRARVAREGAALRRLLAQRPVRARFGPLGEEGALRRVPRGFAADHPMADLLRRVSFTIAAPLTDDVVVDRRLATRVARDFARATPFVRWLNDALGHAPHATRLP